MFKDLSKRLVGSLIAVLFVVASFFSIEVLAIGLIGLAARALFELKALFMKKRIAVPFPLLFALALGQILSFFVGGKWPLIAFGLSLALLVFSHFRQVKGALQGISASCFSFLYIAVPLGLAIPIYQGSIGGASGPFLYLFLLAATKGTDIGAYFGGRLLGRHPLAPSISPKKTIEGAFFGLLFALAISALFAYFLGGTFWFFLGALLGVVGQVGDLAESVLKRDAEVKDSSNLPGLGGVLDLLDSLLFNLPVVYLCL